MAVKVAWMVLPRAVVVPLRAPSVSEGLLHPSLTLGALRGTNATWSAARRSLDHVESDPAVAAAAGVVVLHQDVAGLVADHQGQVGVADVGGQPQLIVAGAVAHAAGADVVILAGDGLGMPAELGPRQPARPINLVARLAALQVAVELGHRLGVTLEPDQGLGPPAVRRDVGRLQFQRQVAVRQRFRVAPRLQVQPGTVDVVRGEGGSGARLRLQLGLGGPAQVFEGRLGFAQLAEQAGADTVKRGEPSGVSRRVSGLGLRDGPAIQA
jgi:hypothetical protein